MEDEKKEVSVEEVSSAEAEATVESKTIADAAAPKGSHVDEEGILEYDDSNASAVDKFFGVTRYGSSMKVEIIGGIVTFLAMCYILTVNPNNILWTGTADIHWSSLFIATAVGAIIGTLLMALVAKMPFAQAPGLGLNSTVGTLIGGGIGAYSAAYGKVEFSFGNAMLLVLISGIIFLIVSIVPIGKEKETGKLITLREKIFDGMPVSIRKAISVGIGLFIAFIGLQNAKIIVDNPYTLVSFVQLNADGAWKLGGAACNAVVCLFGFILIAVLSHYKVKGAIIIGILGATLLAWPLKVTSFDYIKGDMPGITWKFWENFERFFKSYEDGGVAFTAFTDGFDFPSGSAMTAVMVVITFCMIDMFDTMGTVVGCATTAGLVDKEGKPHNYNKIMISDSVATVAGAALGTSTVTTFVESGSGIAAGAKTGLASLVTAVCFLLAIFLLPIFAFIPIAAAASALIYVGVLMMGNVKEIDFKNPLNAVPAFITILTMPLTYSITTGIGLGIITYVILNCIAYVVGLLLYALGKTEEKPKWNISIVCLVVFALFLVYFLVPTSF
ncbi:MAG: NCS2 family permease [Acholeplasmatales bacterium]|nr:NCS2 family permease [Acholeplasmatales bacterium]